MRVNIVTIVQTSPYCYLYSARDSIVQLYVQYLSRYLFLLINKNKNAIIQNLKQLCHNAVVL